MARYEFKRHDYAGAMRHAIMLHKTGKLNDAVLHILAKLQKDPVKFVQELSDKIGSGKRGSKK